jgi:hypothetical protein
MTYDEPTALADKSVRPTQVASHTKIAELRSADSRGRLSEADRLHFVH